MKRTGTLIGLFLATSFVATAQYRNLRATDYRPRSNDEIDLFAAVLSSEIAANHWSGQDAICFSIAGQDPSKALVSELRKRKLNVCSQAEWRKKLACSFAVWLSAVTFDSSDRARVRIQSTDFRDVNTGAAHIVTLLREGEYALQRTTDGWSVAEWTPDVSKKN